MHVQVLCTDDEILTGKTIDTNYGHMARRLGEVGPTVHWGTTIDRESLLKGGTPGAKLGELIGAL